jgi:hypothetical protein
MRQISQRATRKSLRSTLDLYMSGAILKIAHPVKECLNPFSCHAFFRARNLTAKLSTDATAHLLLQASMISPLLRCRCLASFLTTCCTRSWATMKLCLHFLMIMFLVAISKSSRSFLFRPLLYKRYIFSFLPRSARSCWRCRTVRFWCSRSSYLVNIYSIQLSFLMFRPTWSMFRAIKLPR